MGLASMIYHQVNPGLVRDYLMRHFDYVDVVESGRDGWFWMFCIKGQGQDARLRLRLQFIWSPAGDGGWLYRILPGKRA